MSNECWQETLATILKQPNKRIAIVGMGHLLRGDDAVGLYIIDRLQSEISTIDNILLLDAGSAPENFTGKIRSFAPDVVLFIDAVDMQAEARHIRLIELNKISVIAASTHTLSLRLLSNFLRHEIGCDVLLLGIQPYKSELISPLSAPVKDDISEVSDFICEFLHKVIST
jgi:hydrogenase 3 maturation protease